MKGSTLGGSAKVAVHKMSGHAKHIAKNTKAGSGNKTGGPKPINQMHHAGGNKAMNLYKKYSF